MLENVGRRRRRLQQTRDYVVGDVFGFAFRRDLMFHVDDHTRVSAVMEVFVETRWLIRLLLERFHFQSGFVALIVNPRENEHIQNKQGASDGDGDTQGGAVRDVTSGLDAGQSIRAVLHSLNNNKTHLEQLFKIYFKFRKYVFECICYGKNLKSFKIRLDLDL